MLIIRTLGMSINLGKFATKIQVTVLLLKNQKTLLEFKVTYGLRRCATQRCSSGSFFQGIQNSSFLQ